MEEIKRFILKVFAVSLGWDHLVWDFIQAWNIDDSYGGELKQKQPHSGFYYLGHEFYTHVMWRDIAL